MIHDMVRQFLVESNRIEGIYENPTRGQIDAAIRFIQMFQVGPVSLSEFQANCAPNAPLREHEGMNVRVGGYVAPPGGPQIRKKLIALLKRANNGADPWRTHVAFEMLHPYMDGNGRTGRMLWAGQMNQKGSSAFSLPFLHRFYYQTLAGQRR